MAKEEHGASILLLRGSHSGRVPRCRLVVVPVKGSSWGKVALLADFFFLDAVVSALRCRLSGLTDSGCAGHEAQGIKFLSLHLAERR